MLDEMRWSSRGQRDIAVIPYEAFDSSAPKSFAGKLLKLAKTRTLAEPSRSDHCPSVRTK